MCTMSIRVYFSVIRWSKRNWLTLGLRLIHTICVWCMRLRQTVRKFSIFLHSKLLPHVSNADCLNEPLMTTRASPFESFIFRRTESEVQRAKAEQENQNCVSRTFSNIRNKFRSNRCQLLRNSRFKCSIIWTSSLLHIFYLYPKFHWQKNLANFGPDSNVDLVFVKFQLFARKFHWLLQFTTDSVKLAWP